MSKTCWSALLIGLVMGQAAFGGADSARKEPERKEKERLTMPMGSSSAALQGNSLFTGLGVGMFVAASGDAASTEWGLTRPYLYEANPLMRSRPIRIASHAVVPLVTWWASDHLHKNGQRKLALAMRIAVVAVYGYATLHNTRILSRMK